MRQRPRNARQWLNVVRRISAIRATSNTVLPRSLKFLVFAGVIAAVPLSQGYTRPPGWQGGPGWSPDQERREDCWRLRNRAREIRDRMYYAPPWERERMEHRLWEIRDRARGECWGGGRE